LGGEDEVVIPQYLAWDDDLSTPIEDAAAKKILFNITASMQWSGLRVCFAYNEKDGAE